MQQFTRSLRRATRSIGQWKIYTAGGGLITPLRIPASSAICAACRRQQSRSIFSFSTEEEKVPEPKFPWFPEEERGLKETQETPLKQPVLASNNLFHPLSRSPLPSMRAIGKRIGERAYCPHNVKHEIGKHRVTFECPDCGIPVYCCEE